MLIKTEKLSKIYAYPFSRRQVQALKELTIEVNRGEVFGLIGPNGSGKTTTMKLLLGLIKPTSGKIEVFGLPPSSVEAKRRLSFLPEETYLYGFMNADETLDFFGKLFGIERTERRKRIDDLIAYFELDHARKRPVREYSKGMARRVSFAQALINDPDLLILDEPTSGLDPISSNQMKNLILELKQKGKTIFLSSHLLADVQDVCDRIALLFEGSLRKYGSVKDLIVNKDVLNISCTNLNQESINEVKQVIEKSGATVLSTENSVETLESMFIKTVKESKKAKWNE